MGILSLNYYIVTNADIKKVNNKDVIILRTVENHIFITFDSHNSIPGNPQE
jgi:hypothetical protein